MQDRRKFLQVASATAAATGAGPLLPANLQAADYSEPVPEARGLTSYLKDACIQVRYDNLPVAAYRSGQNQKYPYFSPLNGPASGLSLITESALPYPHHRGLWLGCEPLNGGDYWADNGLESGQIKTTSLEALRPTDGNRHSFRQSCSWRHGSNNPLDDERTISFERPDDQHVYIDIDFALTAREDVSITRAKHSFFAMRAAADITPAYGGTLINSDGLTGAKGTYGKTAKWCGYYGERRLRPGAVEGIVIMNHPTNFSGDCPWFTRDYGHLSPSPFNFQNKPWNLANDSTLTLRYRVVLFAGTPKDAGLSGIYGSWLKGR